MKGGLLLLSVALLACAGCKTERHLTDARHPEIALTADGGVTYRGRFVDPEDLPGLLRDAGFDREDTINIHCPDGMNDWRLQRKVMAILSRNGFTRPVLVGDRRASATLGRTAEERRRDARQERLQRLRQGKPVTIRYKN